MNLLKTLLFFVVFNFQFSILSSQAFVKKDSSEILPFKAIAYQGNYRYQSSKIYDNHLLSPNFNTDKESLLLGNLGWIQVPILIQNPFNTHLNLGRTQVENYYYNEKSIPYFSVNKPLSELDFVFFGNGNEVFKGLLSQNLNSRLNLGVGISRAINKGYFQNQSNQQNNIYLTLVYQKDKWRSNLEIYYNDLTSKVSGGYQEGIYDSVDPKFWKNSIPNFQNAIAEFKTYKVSLRNRYVIGKINKNLDSTQLMMPISSNLILDHQISFSENKNSYSDTLNSVSKPRYGIYGNSLDNKIQNIYQNQAIESRFDMNYKHQGLKLNGYNIISYNLINDRNTLLKNLPSNNDLIIGLGGKVDYTFNNKLYFRSEGYKSFSGYTANDFMIKASLYKDIDKWNLKVESNYSHQLPAYQYNYQVNSSLDSFRDLFTQKTFENSLQIQNDALKLNIKLQYFMINDFLTFDKKGNPIQVENKFAQLYARKVWQYKSLYCPTTIMYQNSIFSKGYIRQTLAYNNSHFKDKLNLMLGADFSFLFDYNVAKLSPFLMQPLYEDVMPQAKFYPKVDLFATMKISKVHISFVFDNFLGTYLKTGNYYTQFNPMNPSTFYFRANWQFLD